MNEYRYIIWDFDGTLYDTYERIVRAVKKGMDEMGIKAGNQDVKTGIGGFARRFDQVDTLNSTKFGADEDGGALFHTFRFHVTPFCTDHIPRPSDQ